jgi:hypothetical protein
MATRLTDQPAHVAEDLAVTRPDTLPGDVFD